MSGDVLEKSVLLRVSAEIAFSLFTEQASLWWPESRRHTKDPRSEIALLASGRFWERASDGREVDLGRVLKWEPPTRIVLAFYPGTDAAHPTEVTVRFVPEVGATRVVIEHRPTPASAELWKERVSRFAASWDALLPALAAHALTLA